MESLHLFHYKLINVSKKHIHTTDMYPVTSCMYSCSQSHEVTNYACTRSYIVAVYKFSKPLWLLKIHRGYFISLYLFIIIMILGWGSVKHYRYSQPN